MGTGIIVCGLNGSGKSTLGKALAEQLGFYFLDIEELYFPKNNPDYLYASPRSREEVQALLLHELKEHGNFVLASVKGDYGETVYPFFQYVILLKVPKKIRLQRVKNRSYEKFGKRMLPGGDLYEQEKHFFELVKSKSEDAVDEWARSLNCPMIQVDGTKPVKETVDMIVNDFLSPIQKGSAVIK